MDNNERTYIDKAERWIGDTLTEQTAHVYATLAVAEQLKRIADLLEAGMGKGVDYDYKMSGEGEGKEYRYFRVGN